MVKKTGLYVGIFVVAAAAAIYWNARQTSAPAGMTAEDTTSIEEGAPLANVNVPVELSAGASVGKRAYEAKCATCHGKNAAGQNGIAPPLVHQIYRPGHHADIAFEIAAANGVTSHHWQFGNMPPVEGITRADVKSIVAYVRELQRANGIN